jgi:hypothetical protein
MTAASREWRNRNHIGVAVCLWLVFRKMQEFNEVEKVLKFLEGVGK